MHKALTLILLSATFLGTPVSWAKEQVKSPIGRKVENFKLQDYRGKEHRLSDFKQKFLVVAFLGTECPVAKLYSPRLAALEKELTSKGVGFLGINSNRQDSITEIAAHARIHGVKFPILKDLGNKVADQMGAVRTPEVFVLDEARVVRYWGRVDDQYGIGYLRDEPKRADLKIALEELLAGKVVSKPVTVSVGCHIGRVKQAVKDSPVTYSNQIARLLQNRCVECHRKGEIAPFALTDYKEVAGWAEMIAEVVHEERMPPWHASKEYGKFHNDRRLSKEEKELIFTWVKNGAPEGDPKDLPKPRTYTTGWQLPTKPDVVVEMPEEYSVPAEGTVRYKYFVIDPKFKEDKWFTSAELLPGNRAVVHHILAFALPPGNRRLNGVQGFLVGYVPGLRAKPFPKGMAKKIPAGSKIVFQVHYTPNGSAQKDRSKLGLIFADPKTITHEVRTTSAAQRFLQIPPNASNHKVSASSRRAIPESKLLSFLPHMHLRGKSFKYELVYPDGKKETVLDVPHYDFNWQTSYRLEKPKSLPNGTRMACVAHYDNSEENLANPDPTRTVRWGDQTWDEMMIGYFDIAVPREPEEKPEEKTPVEPKPATEAVKKRAKRLMATFDKNGDGKIMRDEVSGIYRAGFNRLDGDGDGKITYEELLQQLNR